MSLINKGLTVVELLVVFFIIGLLVAAATPTASKMYQESRLNRRADEVVAYFRQARQLAVTEQTTYGIKAFPSTSTFQLIRLTEDPANPGQFIEGQVSSFTVESPLTVSSSTLSEGEVLTFNNIGNPSEAAEVILEDDFQRRRAVCVNAVGSTQLIIGNQCP